MGARPRHARRCKFTVEQIAHVLRCRREVPTATLRQIAEATGVTKRSVKDYLSGTLPRLYLETLPVKPTPVKLSRHYTPTWSFDGPLH